MKKAITCSNCRKKLAVQGKAAHSQEVPQNVVCPHCQKTTQVRWPINAPFHVEKLGS